MKYIAKYQEQGLTHQTACPCEMSFLESIEDILNDTQRKVYCVMIQNETYLFNAKSDAIRFIDECIDLGANRVFIAGADDIGDAFDIIEQTQNAKGEQVTDKQEKPCSNYSEKSTKK